MWMAVFADVGVTVLAVLNAMRSLGKTGEVAHVLVGAGEGVEKRGFAAILIADQGENHTAASFTWIFVASSTRRVSS